MKRLTTARLISFFGSKTFFWLIIGLFVVQASWIALTARYPQAFDEQFHFGLIQLYSHHLSPFLTQQPDGPAAFSAVTRDPSYLYHYLLSFPYRLIAHFFASQTTQIILLRLINVALLASSLVIFKKILRRTPASEAISNVTLAFLVLLPVFPLLGAQINYDNLLIPLSGLAIYWTLQLVSDLKQQRWDWGRALRWAILCILASLVKYAFLALFAGLGLVVGITWLMARRSKLQSAAPSKFKAVFLVLALMLSLGLLWQRDGINTITYHTPVPECDQVLSVDRCLAFGPWARNYYTVQQHIHLTPAQVLTFPFIWVYHMMGELVFTITSYFDEEGSVQYTPGVQLIVVEVLAWSILAVGSVLLAWQLKRFWKQPVTRLYLIVSGLYIGVLFAQNYSDYVHVGQPYAIHGRYLFPILPLLLILVALSFDRGITALRKSRALGFKTGLASLALVVMLLEGGFVTYLVRSDSSWFWPQSQAAQKVNTKAKAIVKPLVIDTEN